MTFLIETELEWFTLFWTLSESRSRYFYRSCKMDNFFPTLTFRCHLGIPIFHDPHTEDRASSKTSWQISFYCFLLELQSHWRSILPIWSSSRCLSLLGLLGWGMAIGDCVFRTMKNPGVCAPLAGTAGSSPGGQTLTASLGARGRAVCFLFQSQPGVTRRPKARGDGALCCPCHQGPGPKSRSVPLCGGSSRRGPRLTAALGRTQECRGK